MENEGGTGDKERERERESIMLVISLFHEGPQKQLSKYTKLMPAMHFLSSLRVAVESAAEKQNKKKKRREVSRKLEEKGRKEVRINLLYCSYPPFFSFLLFLMCFPLEGIFSFRFSGMLNSTLSMSFA